MRASLSSHLRPFLTHTKEPFYPLDHAEFRQSHHSRFISGSHLLPLRFHPHLLSAVGLSCGIWCGFSCHFLQIFSTLIVRYAYEFAFPFWISVEIPFYASSFAISLVLLFFPGRSYVLLFRPMMAWALTGLHQLKVRCPC